MDMEGALRARLLAAAPITALGAKVYWDERPQGAELPDVTLLLVADMRDQHMKGFQATRKARLQADVRGRTFAEKKALKEAVIATIAPPDEGNGIRFQRAADLLAHTSNERTEAQFIYRDIIDLTLIFSPA